MNFQLLNWSVLISEAVVEYFFHEYNYSPGSYSS